MSIPAEEEGRGEGGNKFYLFKLSVSMVGFLKPLLSQKEANNCIFIGLVDENRFSHFSIDLFEQKKTKIKSIDC